ncbi:MAG: Gfo/Idh/MocA family oxidoreductase [Clostridia bacterium]|nr:Gfo/Idh/MocA family oxidoreductase [Clostridia bacterium]
MKEKINIAIIGLGCRGTDLLNKILLPQTDVEIVGVCDSYGDRVEEACKKISEKTGKNAFATSDYKQVLDINGLDAVVISTAWEYHLKIAIHALKKGVAVALEVGGAFSLEELWELVRTQEKTKTPFMFMENCCFDKSELLATAMVRKGVLGTIVHMEGAYSHDLREEIAGGAKNRHYRLRNYLYRNCENYPTHEIGPIAKILDINRGNRFVSLVSVASKAVGMKEYALENAEKYPELNGLEFNQGDIVTTVITCANGETVTIKLDTTLPRFYTRNFIVRGTKGFYEQNTNTVFLDGPHDDAYDPAIMYRRYLENGKDYEKEYLPEFWQIITSEQLSAGHGGMDYFIFRNFIDSIKSGTEPCIDVYDAATWMAISVLSEQSIKNGGAPICFPDFTDGKWMMRQRKDVCQFKL